MNYPEVGYYYIGASGIIILNNYLADKFSQLFGYRKVGYGKVG